MTTLILLDRLTDFTRDAVKDLLLPVRQQENDAEAPAMCDTLFRRAEAARNVRMQAIALCVRLDHFYYKNDRAEILEGVRRVQEFCRRHPKEDLRYFYYLH